MYGIFEDVAKVIGAMAGFMMAVERDDGGEEKKQKVIEATQELLKEFNDELPNWLINIVSNEKILSLLIDLLHTTLKRAGFLS